MVDGDCIHKFKRHLLLGRKAITNQDSILKSRDITLLTMVLMSKIWLSQEPCTDVQFGLSRRLSAEKLMLLNCGVGEDSESPLDCKEIQSVNPQGNQS